MVAGATLLATAIAGAWPAFKATRQDALGGLRSDGWASDVRFGRAAGLIVITQIALSVVMLHGALVVAQSLRGYTTHPVSLPANVLTLGMGVNGVRKSADGTRSRSVSAAEVEQYAATMPGVLAAGMTTALPRHSPPTPMIELEPVPGGRSLPARRTPSASVSSSYFEVLDGSVRLGRNFAPADALAGAQPVAVVNVPFVREVLGGATPLGRRFRTTSGSQTGEWPGRAAIQVLAGGAIGAALARLSLEGRDVLVSRLSDGGPWTLPLVMLLLVGAGLAATWVPLRRALRIRPQEALKAE